MTISEKSIIPLDLTEANVFRIMGAVRRFLLDAGQPKRAALFIKLMSHPTSTYKDLIEFAQLFVFPTTFTWEGRPWPSDGTGEGCPESPMCLFPELKRSELRHSVAGPSLRAPGEVQCGKILA
jgi:hypothetical protein